MRWTPHVTVAAVIENQGQFLVVEEIDSGRQVFNQPAGHLEPNETLIDAVIRETLEETGLVFEPENLVGIYKWEKQQAGPCYLRFCFAGKSNLNPDAQPLDKAIIATHWKTLDELHLMPLRSPLVLRCIEDYQLGMGYSLSMIQEICD